MPFISSLMRAMSSSALSLLNFSMRCILISMSRRISSRVTSRTKLGLKGVSFSSMKATASSMLLACSNRRSLYMRSSINIFSSEEKKSCSMSSPRRICSSWRSSPMVQSVEWRSTSLTVKNCGLLSSMTQQFGEMLISQSEKA